MTIPHDLAQHLRDMGMTEPKPTRTTTPHPTERGWMPTFKGEEPPF